jgi:hypothetical protein
MNSMRSTVSSGGVVGFRIPKLVGVNGDAVFEDLRKLGAVRLETAVADAEERRRFFAEDQAGGLRESLAVVVAGDAGQRIEIQHRGFLADINLGALHIGQERPLDVVVLFGLGLDAHGGELNDRDVAGILRPRDERRAKRGRAEEQAARRRKKLIGAGLRLHGSEKEQSQRSAGVDLAGKMEELSKPDGHRHGEARMCEVRMGANGGKLRQRTT